MSKPVVAYVLKGYPRMSELFIASEIARLEQLKMDIRLFVLKSPDEVRHHPVVDRIKAAPAYLTETSSLSNEPLWRWLRGNLRPFIPALIRRSLRHPLRTGRAMTMAGAQSVRARKGWTPRKIYVKEFLLAAELADRLRKHRDVTHLHGHFAHGTTTVTWLCSALTGLPFSFTGHAKDIYQQSLNPAGLLPRKMRAAEFVVTCTDANRQHLQELAPGVPVHVVYHGLNADFSPLAEHCPDHVAPKNFRVISVGRLVKKKGFDILVSAIKQLVDNGVEVELVIAGEDGESGEPLRRQINDAGLGNTVTLLGPLTQLELFESYRASSVFALACRVTDDGDRDGIPNVMMEAMAAGLPVVSTAVSGIPELVVDGHNGLLIEPDNPEALADAIWRLAKDPALMERLGRAGREDVLTRFDGPTLAARMVTLFEGVER